MSRREWLITLSSIAIMVMAGSSALAQGCVMCKTSAEAAAETPSQVAANNLAILILLIPAFLLLSGMWLMAYRYRDSFHAEELNAPPQTDNEEKITNS